MLISWQLDYFTLVRENNQAKISLDRTSSIIPMGCCRLPTYGNSTELFECGYFLFSKTGLYFFKNSLDLKRGL